MFAEKEYVIQSLDQNTLAQEAIEKGLNKPFKDNFERYCTLNNYGFMFGIFDQVVKDFLFEISKGNNQVALEIGCAYGNVAVEAARRGCKNYIASDISVDHLRVLARTLQEIGKPQYKDAISLIKAKFPEELDLPANSVDLALMNKVMHFFDLKEMEIAMKKIRYITAPGGKWFILTVSPKCKDFKKFDDEYQRRKKLGVGHPGFCPNAGDYSTNAATTDQLPFSMYFFDLEELTNMFESNGFRVRKTYSIDMPCNDNLNWNEGHDMVGIIAEKK